jgi:pimeloyl-ACP methyl ester carboxylesterase
MSHEEMETLYVSTHDGRTLEALVTGPREGTVLVFHSGTPFGLVPLPSGLDPAAMGIRTLLYARPGYGRSSPQPGRSVADAASDTAAILDALEVEQFINVGWSGGGPPALACDALLADRCLATAVIAGIAPYTEADTPSEVRSWYEEDEDNKLWFAGEVAEFRRCVDAFVRQLAESDADGIAANTTSEADRRFLSEGYGEWVASCFKTAGVSGSVGAADDYLASFRDWGFPLAETRNVTIWHGSDDQNVPPSHGEWLARHLPAAELRALDDEGHISIVGHLPEIIEELRSRAN